MQRLPWPDEKENPHPREDLDRELEVHLWWTNTTRRAYREEPTDPGAPSWWHGDEEASQVFFRSMNIDPTKLGG